MSAVSRFLATLWLAAATLPSGAQSAVGDARIAALESELRSAQERVLALEATLTGLTTQLGEIKAAQAGAPRTPTHSLLPAEDAPATMVDRIIVGDLASDKREEELKPKPELFVQTAYFDRRIDGATAEDALLNFGLNRMELAWGGRVGERVGMGYEIQYHPAPDGASEELVNDAFVEYYASDALTLRVGQFIKPFGFDIQHSSAARESPERGIFAGYLFPGQRDRGVMLRADLDRLGWWSGTTLHVGAFNGNRFFGDNNDALNYNVRLRRVFPSGRLALGASYQAGRQILPAGVPGNDDENAFGLDLQMVAGRLGIRAEYVRGNTPSTLLSLTPEFAPAFVPGAKSWGGALFFNYGLNDDTDLYWRWDRFDNDPVSGENPRAFNVGYLRRLGENSRIAVDYQRKSDVTYNDDALNSEITLRWDVVY